MRTAHESSRGGPARRRTREPARSRDGVDLTLIREMLALTPAERLQRLQSSANMVLSLRNARRES